MHPDFDPPFTARQLRELMVHRSRLFPWGYHRITTGEAAIWAMIGNVNRKAGSPGFSPSSILPKENPQEDDGTAFVAMLTGMSSDGTDRENNTDGGG